MFCGFIRGLPEFMRARGIDVAIATTPTHHSRTFQAHEDIVAYDIFMKRTIAPFHDVIATVRLWTLLRRLRPDILHTHTPKASLLGALVAWVAGVPVVHSVHGLVHLGRAGPAGWLARESERIACKLAHRVICVSSSIRDVLVDQNLCSSEKAVGSVTAVDAESRFNPQCLPQGIRARVRHDYGIPDNALVVGYCGRVVRDKGISDLVDAWASLRDRYPILHLLLVGPIEQEDPIPPRTLSVLREDSRIVLTGEVDDTAPFYAAMDLVVLPSYREGFGTVVIEANAMELPVVATNIPGCVDAVAADETGVLVPPHSPVALEAAIARYLDDSDLREEHGRSGRMRVLRCFRPTDVFRHIYVEYRRVEAETLFRAKRKQI
jgi:glycosyltransferase involved in cell wall biosynthesis